MRFGVLAQRHIIVGLVPGEMQRDARGQARQLLDDATILNFLKNIIGFAGQRIA